MPPQPGSAGKRGCKNIRTGMSPSGKGPGVMQNNARGLIYTARKAGQRHDLHEIRRKHIRRG